MTHKQRHPEMTETISLVNKNIKFMYVPMLKDIRSNKCNEASNERYLENEWKF
jgi:hypothetical protein